MWDWKENPCSYCQEYSPLSVHIAPQTPTWCLSTAQRAVSGLEVICYIQICIPFSVQGNYLVRKFLKCILLGFFGDVWSVLCIQCWSQSEEQSTCTGMELVVVALVISRAKRVFSGSILGPFRSLQEPSSRGEVYLHHGCLTASRLLSGQVMILTLALQLPSTWGWASLNHCELRTDTLTVSCCWVDSHCKWEVAQLSCLQ